MGEVQFSVQHARNQVLIGAHNQRTDILQVKVIYCFPHSSLTDIVFTKSHG
jgi:hypothetical protein